MITNPYQALFGYLNPISSPSKLEFCQDNVFRNKTDCSPVEAHNPYDQIICLL